MSRTPAQEIILKLYNAKMECEKLAEDAMGTMCEDKEEQVKYWRTKAKEIEILYQDIKKQIRGNNDQ